MAATGCTITFLKKRFHMGDMNAVAASFLISGTSAGTFNISKSETKIKNIVGLALGARNLASGGVLVRQNIRSATTVEIGTIWGSGFQDGDQISLIIFGY